MRTALDFLGSLLLFVVAILALTGTAWFFLYSGRPMAIFGEETRRQVYETSRSYQQGTQSALARYCFEMRAGDEAHRKAMAALIRDEASTYHGPVSSDVAACLSEANQ